MKYFAVSCSLFLLKPYFINMSELIEAIRYNISQREIFVVLVTNMKPYFYLFSAVNITISGDAFFTYTFIRVCWRNSEMSQILGAPILQSGVISAWQGKGRLIGELFSSQPQTPYWTLNPYILLTKRKEKQ